MTASVTRPLKSRKLVVPGCNATGLLQPAEEALGSNDDLAI